MSASELDKAVDYVKQFIDTMTPIAKQAYEIGLLTLRIDALQSLFAALVALVACLLFARWARATYAAAKVAAALPENARSCITRDPSDHLVADGMIHILGSIFSACIGVLSIATIFNVWLWVKLFAPQIWLAHRAIEKIVG